MKNKLFIIFSIAFIISMTTCHSTNKLQVYRFIPYLECDSCDYLEMMDKWIEVDSVHKSIALKNDSILEFSKLYGRLGSLMTMRYVIINNELIIDSTDIGGYYIPEISNVHFIYSKDSLINKKTNETYYNQKYLKKTYKMK